MACCQSLTPIWCFRNGESLVGFYVLLPWQRFWVFHWLNCLLRLPHVGPFVALVARHVYNYWLSLSRWLMSFVDISSSHGEDGLVLLPIN
jgi:hypothetical protein